MAVGKAVLKVVGGKLLRAEVEHEEGIIKRVKLSGDFFLYPEEALEAIELDLQGATVEQVADRVNETAKALNAELVGFSAKDVQAVVEMAVSSS
jgi:lipoate-protein ligase A